MITTQRPFLQIPFADYLAIDAVSQSSIKPLITGSPAHYRHAQDNPKDPSEAQETGTFGHSMVLEPETLLSKYVVMPTDEFVAQVRTKDGKVPKNPRATAEYKDLCEEFVANNPDKSVVEQETYDHIKALSKAIWSNEAAGMQLLRAKTREAALLWTDAASGLECKGRCDAIDAVNHIIVDVKTTNDILRFSFGRFCYDVQSAFYLDGYEAITGHKARFFVIVAETQPPYCVQAAFVSDATIAAGRARYKRALRQLRECRENDHWPGPDDPQSWSLSDWEINKHFEECA